MKKRYAFCNFSSIFGYPHPVPNRDEWERSILRFRGEEWEVPTKHLLDFHDFIHRIGIVHEDIQIKFFRHSLEGISLDWCRSLPSANIISLAYFHASFHVFCKDQFSNDFLYPKCCHEFNLLNKELDTHEEYVVVEDTLHYDREISNPHYDNLSDAFDIVPNASTILGCHEDHIFPSENFEDVEQIDISVGDSFGSAANTKSSPHLSVLQTKGNCSRHEEKDDEQKGPDHQSILYVPLKEVEKSTFSIEIIKGSLKQHFIFQLEQQQGEVFHCDFDDPIADYLHSISNINVQILFSDESGL
jgi:hypothetical protein